MVGVDGVPRELDFGVAKAVSRSQSTRQGQLKGLVAYMAPEQLGASPIDRRADTFLVGVRALGLAGFTVFGLIGNSHGQSSPDQNGTTSIRFIPRSSGARGVLQLSARY
jgi:serine/threonine-protein kinase